jgi:hypothetical protein
MKIISELENYLPSSKNHMSSYGIQHLYNSDYHNINNGMNSGTFDYITFYRKIKSVFYNVLINKIFGKDINNNFFIKNYRKLCKKQKRLFDLNLIINSIVLKILQDRNLLTGKICTIGDGKANFVSGCLFLKESSIKIYSVNLPQALIQDYIILNKFNLIEDKLIKVVNAEEDLLDKDINLFLIPVQNKFFLDKKNINLFVNTSSFQEMPINETRDYFNIIKSNEAFLYCLNREEKIMYDGTSIRYKDYNFHLAKKIIFEEEAKFQRYFYNLRPPMVHRKKTKMIHTLAKF